QHWPFFDLPPAPKPDVKIGGVYYSSASASGVPADSDCGPKYLDDTGNLHIFRGCQDCSWKTYYITGGAYFDSGGDGNFICGNVIVLGDIEINGGGGANGDYDANVPQEAWKEYGNDYADAYVSSQHGFDDTEAPDTYAEAVAENYKSVGLTYRLKKGLVHGFVYTGGSQGLKGGGSSIIHGVMIAGQNTTIETSGFAVYFDESVAENILVENIVINRISWYEVAHEWPAGL
ncbi:unnamed protein product, partial [marine sediment metagenome]